MPLVKPFGINSLSEVNKPPLIITEAQYSNYYYLFHRMLREFRILTVWISFFIFIFLFVFSTVFVTQVFFIQLTAVV